MREKNKKQGQLIACSVDLQSSRGVPTEIQLLPFGEWKGYRDEEDNPVPFKITPELAQAAVDYHMKMSEKFPTRDLVIDYEHQSQESGEAPAAGWFNQKIYLKDDGIYATVKEWTKRAADYIANKEYRYMSPVFALNRPDKVTGEIIPLRFKSSTLTNNPFLDNIKPLSAKEDDANQTIIYLTDVISPQSKGDTAMLEKILKLLGLDPAATLEVVEAKIAELMNAGSTVAAKYKSAMHELSLKDDASIDDVKAFAARHNAILTELGVKPTDTLDAIKQVIVAAKDKGKSDLDSPKVIALTERVNALNLALTERDFSDVIKKHQDRGAIMPNEVDDLKSDVTKGLISCKDLDARLAKRTDNSMVPMGKIISASDTTNKAIDQNTLEIAGRAGVTKEEIEKFGK